MFSYCSVSLVRRRRQASSFTSSSTTAVSGMKKRDAEELAADHGCHKGVQGRKPHRFAHHPGVDELVLDELHRKVDQQSAHRQQGVHQPCILTHEKSSLAPPGVSLAFSPGDEGGFRWVGEYDITADEMLSGIEPQRETKTQQAKDLICTLLAGGKRVFSEDIDKAALERGIPGRTVRDAKRELGDAMKSKIVEGRKKVFWME